MRDKSRSASVGLQILFSYVTIGLNFCSVGIDFYYFIAVLLVLLALVTYVPVIPMGLVELFYR